jgi:hypothetical protein
MDFRLALLIIITLVLVISARSEAQMPMDLRATAVRSELDKFYADSDADIWQLAFWDNLSLESHKDWHVDGSNDFKRLTHGQQLLVLVGQADGEIGNGGIGQLFFNRAGSAPDMQSAFEEMGCAFASDFFSGELDRLSKADFISKWQAASKGFSESSQAGDKERAWEEFTDFIAEFYPEAEGWDFDPVSQRYWDKRKETLACIRLYMNRNEAEFFIVSGK